MKKVRNWLNQLTNRPTEEVTTMASKTEPDKILTLRELVARHTRGQNVTVFNPQYQEDEEFDQALADLGKFDEMEKAEYMKTLAEAIKEEEIKLKETQARIKQQKDHKAKALKEEKERKAKYAAYLESVKDVPADQFPEGNPK